MNFIGGIEGMNFKPIAGYNGFLKNNAAFDVDTSTAFDNVLSQQTEALNQNSMKIQGGVEMNSGFDSMVVQGASDASGAGKSAGDLINSFSQSFNGGLNSVNNANVKAERAQEAFAMGEDISVHDVMIAAEKSSLSMQMALQLRNKILSAYTEINNVRV